MFQICQKLKRGLVEVRADIKELRFNDFEGIRF